jgi:hypothetical protein
LNGKIFPGDLVWQGDGTAFLIQAGFPDRETGRSTDGNQWGKNGASSTYWIEQGTGKAFQLGFCAETSEGNVVGSDWLQHLLWLASERKQEVGHFGRLGGGPENIRRITPHCLQPVLDVGGVTLQTLALGHTEFGGKE